MRLRDGCAPADLRSLFRAARHGGHLGKPLGVGHGEIGEVAFTQLPQLGGIPSLRGYARERFRDRIAVTGSIEYEWDLGRHTYASLFVDAGRVMPRWNEPPTSSERPARS